MPDRCGFCEEPESLCTCNTAVKRRLTEIVDKHLHDVYGYNAAQIAQEAYDLGKSFVKSLIQ